MRDYLAESDSPSQGETPIARRKFWDESAKKPLLGEEAYAWFVESAERKLATCRQCNGSGSVMSTDPIAIRRGLYPTACPACSAYVENLTAFTRTYFEVVPRAYRRFTLRTLKPYLASPVSLERQEDVIATLKANPDKSYALFAPAGAGKTALATALFSEMLYRQYMTPHSRWDWFRAKRISTKALLDQHTRWLNEKHSGNPQPEVTSRKIAQVTKSGQIYRLFLEDMNGEDNPARRAALFDVLNTVHENEGQLVITSSNTVAEFRRQYGENLFWRIAQHCKVIDLFNENGSTEVTSLVPGSR
jgi:hypothetical protein